MFRYMAFVWNVTNQSQTEAVDLLSRRLKSLSSQWREVLDHDGMRVLCANIRTGSLEPHLLANKSGVVLGTVLRRNEAPEDDTLSPKAILGSRETESILGSQGRWLIDNCWGNYVALIGDRNASRKIVVKDPTGSLPCFSTEFRGATVVFSCIADCIDLQLLTFTMNRSYLAGRLVDGGSSHAHSPLNEVSQVYRGERVIVDSASEPASLSREFLWTPMQFEHSQNLIENPETAGRSMRATIRSATHSLAACHESLLLRLSGGLDSSIVSGCLRDVPIGPRIACYTYFNPRGRSDERPWARLAAQHAGFEHIECAVTPEDLDLHALLQMPPAVEPASPLEFLQRTSTEKQLNADRGVTAIFTGDGGDSGFCSDSIAYALSEHIHRHGPSLQMFRLAAQIALLTEQSTWTVLTRSLRRLRSGSGAALPKEMLLNACRLVNPAVFAAFTPATQHGHPWFRGVGRIPGGLLRRVGMLVATPDIYNAALPARDIVPEVVSPLYSQPAIELLLRIPIHVHFENGRDRGLARRAFEPDVPQAILQRRWKDRAPGFHDELVHRNQAFLREFFLDGVLVSEGLLDRKAVEAALSPGPVKNNVFPGEIIAHMGTEIWARQWLRTTQQRAVA
jgi:asparagine synthase (glutamine-hydrolysing)